MSKTTEALKLAEEALHNTGNALMCLTTTRNLRPMYQEMRDDAVEGCNKALAAIREALSEPDMKECRHCGFLCKPNPDESKPWYPLQEPKYSFGIGTNGVRLVDDKEVLNNLETVTKNVLNQVACVNGCDGVTGGCNLCPRTDEPVQQEPKCSNHPDAPHGFDRNASHSADRYVCECEGWEPPKHEVNQEPVAFLNNGEIQLKGFWPDYFEAKSTPLYAAPVDAKAIQHELEVTKRCLFQAQEAAKAIRAEALEEAAKVCEEYEGTLHQWTDKGKTFAAAIRGLK